MQLRHLAHQHDDIPAFHAGYLVLSILFAALFNIGAFALLVLAHMTLDVIKYRDVHDMKGWKVAEAVLRESIADLMLLTVGLASVFYLHTTFGVMAFNVFFRAEETIIRALTVFLPKLEVFHHIIPVFCHVHLHLASVERSFYGKWLTWEVCCGVAAFISFVFILFVPFLLGISQETFVHLLEEELVPWRI